MFSRLVDQSRPMVASPIGLISANTLSSLKVCPNCGPDAARDKDSLRIKWQRIRTWYQARYESPGCPLFSRAQDLVSFVSKGRVVSMEIARHNVRALQYLTFASHCDTPTETDVLDESASSVQVLTGLLHTLGEIQSTNSLVRTFLANPAVTGLRHQVGEPGGPCIKLT